MTTATKSYQSPICRKAAQAIRDLQARYGHEKDPEDFKQFVEMSLNQNEEAETSEWRKRDLWESGHWGSLGLSKEARSEKQRADWKILNLARNLVVYKSARDFTREYGDGQPNEYTESAIERMKMILESN